MLNNFIHLNIIEITNNDDFNKIMPSKNSMNNNTKYYDTKKKQISAKTDGEK